MQESLIKPSPHLAIVCKIVISLTSCSSVLLSHCSAGYCRSMEFSQLCVRLFDRSHAHTMKLDDFIQCCVMLKSMTDAFRGRDIQQQGVITISYEQVSPYSCFMNMSAYIRILPVAVHGNGIRQHSVIAAVTATTCDDVCRRVDLFVA